jgi:ribosomal protein L32
MKLSHSKTKQRRSHHRAAVPTATKTPTGVRRRHFADPVTGLYRGKQVLGMATPTSAEKKKEKSAPNTQEKAATESNTTTA